MNEIRKLRRYPGRNLLVSRDRLESSKMACRVVTVAGTIEEGYSDGPGHEARFKNPLEMTLTADGSLLVADYGNHCIRQIDQYGIVSGYAGCPGKTGRTDGPKSSALFNGPMGLCITRDGSVIVGDSGSNVIRKVQYT